MRSGSPNKKGEVVDWRKKGVVTPVKDQGLCGSCWAFSATGSLESFYAIQGKMNLKADIKQFSEQELVDCSHEQGNGGCQGGLMTNAFDYIIAKKIAIEEEYPYERVDGKCRAKKTKSRYPLTSYKALGDEDDVSVLLTLTKQQPISVAIEIQNDFFDYKSGVYTADASCGDDLNHGVLTVGYNTKAKTPYFIVKNSWTENWGNKGYIWMAVATGRGTCGIANHWDAYPTAI